MGARQPYARRHLDGPCRAACFADAVPPGYIFPVQTAGITYRYDRRRSAAKRTKYPDGYALA